MGKTINIESIQSYRNFTILCACRKQGNKLELLVEHNGIFEMVRPSISNMKNIRKHEKNWKIFIFHFSFYFS